MRKYTLEVKLLKTPRELSTCAFKGENTVIKENDNNKYMLLAGWEVRIVKNCDRGLENAARGRRPRAAFSSPRSQFFTILTDPKPVNNLFIFFQALKRINTHRKNSRKSYCDRGQR